MLDLQVLGTTDLRASDGTAVHSVLAQPKRLALLAYLLLARRGGFVRRDTLLALFWPDADEGRARASLRKSVHYLRRSLGADVIIGRGAEELGVDTALLDCDALRVMRLAEEGRDREAVESYGGELLPGFHVDAAPAFDQWLEGTRSSLRRTVVAAGVSAARAALEAGDAAAAAAWQRRAHEIAPHDEEVLRDALALLMGAGRRSEAHELHAAHRSRLADQGEEPDAELEHLLARAVGASSGREDASPRTPPEEVATRGGDPPSVKPRPSVGRRVAAVAAAGALLLTVVLFVYRLPRPAAADGASPLLAVGAIRDFATDDDSIGALIPELLATNLARAPQVRVIGNARISELLAMAGQDAASPTAVADAARRAEAHELVEGALYRMPGGGLRLDLRRVRLSDGELLGTYRVLGRDPFDLVDRATAELTAAIGAAGDETLRVADVTTSSLVALRFYQEGLDAYFQGDPKAARRLFDAALAEDSSFAMAAYYAGRASSLDGPLLIRYLRLADTLAHRTTERERLLIRGTLAYFLDQPGGIAIADTLVRRYPEDPAGHLLLGRSLNAAGRFEDATEPLRNAVALDSFGLSSGVGRCTACEALVALYEAHIFLDSTRIAEQIARRAYEARPTSPGFMLPLVYALQANGRYDEADALIRRAGEAGLRTEWVAATLVANDIRRGDFDEADAALRGMISTSSRPLRTEARWLLVISLRNQGRLDDALGVIQHERDDPGLAEGYPAFDMLTEATVRFEGGEFGRSAELFREIALRAPGEPGSPGRSRSLAWNLTHAANAHAAAGDVRVLPELAERVRDVGARSAYGRDHRLHHHIRGLYEAALGHHGRAVEELRAALFSTASGYTRTNVELARSLLALGRAAEAAAVLDPPLRNGGIESTLYYATRTEMQALLAEAYAAMGRSDLARLEAERALRAWRRADPGFGERVERLRQLAGAP